MSILTDRPLISFSFDDCPQSVMLNALPAMEKRGWRSTIYAAMGLCETTNHLGLHMSEAEIVAAYQSGHEIGNHTFSHLDANAVTTEDFLKDIARTTETFSALGLPKAASFAYPYGEVTTPVKKALSGQYKLLRGIHDIGKSEHIDLNQAASQRLYSGHSLRNCLDIISGLEKTPKWVTFFTHDVRDNPSEFGCTPAEFEQVLETAQSVNAVVLPITEALERIQGSA
jgi:peptidoglycan/xylan/chitin deacetylase (PgdA/CDA1 family)